MYPSTSARLVHGFGQFHGGMRPSAPLPWSVAPEASGTQRREIYISCTVEWLLGDSLYSTVLIWSLAAAGITRAVPCDVDVTRAFGDFWRSLIWGVGVRDMHNSLALVWCGPVFQPRSPENDLEMSPLLQYCPVQYCTVPAVPG